MSFNSFEFIFVFLPVTVTGFWLLLQYAGTTSATVWLLCASIVFYVCSSLSSLAIAVPSILLDYGIAQFLIRTTSARKSTRLAALVLGIAANVLLLSYFKYLNVVSNAANGLLATHFNTTQVALPLGLSFLVFQKIAFLADVHAGKVKTVKLVDYLLFALFFPRTIAGPIVHHAEIVPQFSAWVSRQKTLDIAIGTCLFAIGLFKKVVIADRIAQFVPLAFADQAGIGSPGLLEAWCGVLAYALQLYFDFSGYSDMALGIARMCGVRLPMNFNSPYKAASIVEFWSRWHITLTRFLTAYIYTPMVLHLSRARISKGKTLLQGKRSTFSAIATLVATPTMITMAISGLWHGSGLQFAIWGLLHGIYLTINQTWRLLRPRFWPDHASYERVMKVPAHVLTVGSVVLAFTFFRASSASQAFHILGSMFGANGVVPHYIDLLRTAGEHVDWRTTWYLLDAGGSVSGFEWIVVLSMAVICLPNSLELLRRFEPALDFPESGNEPMARPPVGTDIPAANARAPSIGRLRATWSAGTALSHDGIALNRAAAIAVALLLFVALLALDVREGFQYGKF